MTECSAESPRRSRISGGVLRWLTSIFVLSLLLVFGLRSFFGALEAELRAQGVNERARLFVGEEIVVGIQSIEKQLYQMATTQNPAAFRRLHKMLDGRLAKLEHDLRVLRDGGTATRTLRLNIEGIEETTRSATYYPDVRDGALIMELIEIEPHLETVRERVDALERLLTARWQAADRAEHHRFLEIDEQIQLLLKQLPSFFERLNENANRLFLESDRRLRELESTLQQRRDHLKRLETNLIVVVIVLGGIAGMLYLRRLSDALERVRQARDEVEQQRAQNVTMLNTLSDGVYATDLDGNITFINEAALHILGWSAAELIGRNAHECLHYLRPDGSAFPRDECPLLAVLRQAVALVGEEHFVRRDGSFVPISFRSNPLLLGNKVIGSLISFRDISSEQKAQKRIRLQQAALDAAANMIVITDRRGVIEYVNPSFCRVTGYSVEEILGKSTRQLRSGKQDASFYAQMWGTLNGGRVWEGEIDNRRKDGSIYREQMTITPIVENGDVTHFVAIKRDITEEAETRNRLILLEAAIQETDQALMITAADATEDGPTIRYVNPAFTRVTGLTYEEAVGRRTAILRGPDTDPQLVRHLEQALRAGENLIIEMNYRRKDGTPYVAELHYAPVPDEHGRIANFIATISDISQRREFEAALRQARDQALENARLKSEFLSNMSHEIRTPMNGIIGMSHLLLDTDLTQEQREFATVVRESAHSLLTIINDILDFSKIEAGRLELEEIEFELVGVVEGAVELFAARAREKGIALMSYIDPALPSEVYGDPTRLRQILLNLIGNAVKFTQQGGVEVIVTQETGDSGVRLRYEIRDSGIGIAPQAIGRLFQSFSQADSSTTRRYGGTGLGLAISKQLVELMGGEIGVESVEGQGSTFWFVLPSRPSGRLRTEMARLMPWRVLVLLADRPIDREVLLRYLTAWGIAAECMASGEDALMRLSVAAATSVRFDAVCVDYELPGMTGIEWAEQLRAALPAERPRLILLTPYGRGDLCAAARAAGFSHCLVKPLRQAKLLEALQTEAAGDAEGEEAEPLGDGAHAAGEANRPHVDLRQALEEHRLILLAEDNPVNQRVAQLQLNRLGYAVHVVANGQDAIEAAAALPYAAILMDCQMPLVDGFEASAAIRRMQRSHGRHVPIIALTAHAMQGDRERCLAAGMDDYLSKPIQAEALAEKLATWITPLPKPGVAVETANEPPATEAPALVLDVQRLKDFLGDDPELLAELLDVFVTSTAGTLARLAAAIADRDGSAVKALAHEMRGACGNLGAEAMVRLAKRIEQALADGDWAAVDALNDQLGPAFAAVRQAIAALSAK